MISQTAEYALRAMVFLADHEDMPRTNAEIAEATSIPGRYLAKVMQSLSRAGLVRSQRGLNGGFMLANRAEEQTVLEIIQVVDPIRRFPECPMGIACHGRTLCPLHRKLDDAACQAEATFGETTLSELLNVPARRKPLCRFPNSEPAQRKAVEPGNR